ncbi:MAG: hypothetical protein IPP66_19985 [Anaerolineales bacterium]|nr:hypothetical protein [Anaerolineales bacterium]
MKKFFILLLAVALTACGTPAAPTEAVAPVAPTAVQPVVVTVVVEPTQAPVQPTAAPAEPVVVTVVVEPTQAPAAQPVATQAPALPVADGVVSLDPDLGRGVFTNMTMSSSNVTLRCNPRDVTFNITTPNGSIKDVMFYYRIADLDRLYPSEWKAFGEMNNNGGGNFTLTFKGEDVHPDLRLDGAWLDFQFVGLAKSGDVVDRSDKFESLLKYTFDCE